MANVAARFWIGTLWDWAPPETLPTACNNLRGQREVCPTSGREHHQVVAGFQRAVRLAFVKRVVGDGHWEVCRSVAARAYVWKDETAVAGSRFELGALAMRRNESADWDAVRAAAIAGDLSTIPSDIFVRYYSSLSRISSDHATPLGVEKQVAVFWGPTGTGKSRRAWEEAGVASYPKDPRTKW